MDGVLVIDKPAGPTSHDVVVRVRRATGVTRIGHTGTLDPIATGVLPLVVGRATRLAQFFAAADKEYEATIRFGSATDTYDATGRPIDLTNPESADGATIRAPARGPADSRAGDLVSRAAVEDALGRFRGSFLQQPPPFSAKKIGGVRAYALARQAAPVQPNPVAVTVHSLELLSLQGDRLTVRLVSSAGFYVRTLAHDLGLRLGTGAYLASLRRTRSGEFGAATAVPLEAVEREQRGALDRLVSMNQLLAGLPELVVNDAGARKVSHGNTIGPRHLLTPPPSPVPARVRLVNRDGILVAIAEAGPEPGLLHPAVVLV